jgi:predicted ATP-dependent serine protease
MQLIKKNDKVEVLKDIVVPKKFYSRIDLGVNILNEVFGGQEMPGMMPGASVLFTGTPGAGKSTMALQLADLLAKNAGRNVLYNIGEENRYMVKMRADRLGLAGGFCLTQIEEVDDLMKFCEDNGVEVLFQDSLQMLRDGELSGDKLLKAVCKKLQAWKENSGVTIILIGHSTKGGQFAGPNEIKHDVDVHAHLKLNTDSGNRVFELQKNRFGPGAIPYEFSISSSGLDFQQMKVSDDEDPNNPSAPTSRAADRRGRVVELIKEKMLAGEQVSGYCFERFEVEVSGGFWRGMLARACKELQAEGHTVGETRIDGRLHNFVKGKA